MAADSAGLGLPISLSELSAQWLGDDPMVAAQTRRRRNVTFALPSLTAFDWQAALADNDDVVADQAAADWNRLLSWAGPIRPRRGAQSTDGWAITQGPARAPPASS